MVPLLASSCLVRFFWSSNKDQIVFLVSVGGGGSSSFPFIALCGAVFLLVPHILQSVLHYCMCNKPFSPVTSHFVPVSRVTCRRIRHERTYSTSTVVCRGTISLSGVTHLVVKRRVNEPPAPRCGAPWQKEPLHPPHQ